MTDDDERERLVAEVAGKYAHLSGTRPDVEVSAEWMDKVAALVVAARAVVDNGCYGDEWDHGGWVANELDFDALRAALAALDGGGGPR